MVGVIVAACGSGDADEAAEPTSTAATAPPVTAPPVTAPPVAEPAVTEPPPTEPPATGPPSTEPPVTQPEPGPTAEELRSAVETALVSETGTTSILDRMAELAVPGFAVAVVADGEIVTSFGVGTTPDGQPMDAGTVLQVGSVSKPVAAATALSFAANGDVSLDESIEPLLATYALPPGEQTDDEPVTLARLLSHTAGTNVEGFLGYVSADVAPSLPEVLRGEGDTEAVAVVATPGSGFTYSGGGYQLVEQTMLDVTGAESFDALVRERVFAPAGMTSSFFALDPPDLGVVSIGSINGDALGQGWQRHPENAAAGLWTTADDLGRFLAAFGAALRGDADGLLPTEWATRMVTPVTESDGLVVGSGWFLDDAETPTVFWHNGRNLGYAAEVTGTIDGRFGVAVVTNAFPGGTPLAREIIATVAALQGWGG